MERNRDGSRAPEYEGSGHGQAAVFALNGEYWTIGYAGTVVRLRDAKGLRHIRRLLDRPGERVTCAELLGASDAGPVEAERARVNVARTIKAARERIAAVHPSLGRHLETTLRTGARCAYIPDDRIAIRWGHHRD